MTIPDANEEIRLNAIDRRIDQEQWDAVEAAVKTALDMGFVLENLIDRVRDEWAEQEANRETLNALHG